MERKKGVILSYVLMVFEVLSTLVLTPFIIRSIGQAEYGVYKLAISVAAYMMLLDMGVGNAIVRFVAKYHAVGDILQERRFFAVAQIYYLGIAGIAAICGCILIWVFPRFFAVGLTAEEIVLAQKLLGIITANTVVTMATATFNYIVIGRGAFVLSKGASIVQILLRMILTTIALLCGLKSVALVSVSLICTILTRGALACYVWFRWALRPLLQGVTKAFVFEIIGYSSWILLQMIATQINAFAEQVLLGAFVPGAALLIAEYGVGAQIVQYFQSLGSAVNGVLMPGVVRLVAQGADGQQLQDEMVRIGRILLLMLSPVLGGFLLYGKQFIALWAGTAYVEGYYVVAMLMAAYIFIMVQAIGTQILWAKNEHKEQAVLKFVIVLLNIGLTILLIRWNPLIGAALGTFISLMLGDVLVMNIVFKRKIGLRLGRYYRELLRGIFPVWSAAMLAGFAFSGLGLQGWIGLGINIGVFCLVYGILMLKLGMNAREKQMVSAIIGSIFRKIKKV